MLLAELRTLFRRTRVRVLLAVLLPDPFPPHVAVAGVRGPNRGQRAHLSRPGVTHNGVFAALAGLTVTIPFFLPLTVAVVAGDAIAGEASLGTLRYLLTRPSGRLRLLGVKSVTLAGRICLLAALVVAAGGLIGGADLLSPSGGSSPCRAPRSRSATGSGGRSSPPSSSARRCSAWPPSACSSPP